MPHELIWGIPRLILADLEYALIQPRMGSRYAPIVEGGFQSSQKRHTSILGCGIPRIGLKLTWSIPRLLRSSGTRYTPKYRLRYTSTVQSGFCASVRPSVPQKWMGYTSIPPSSRKTGVYLISTCHRTSNVGSVSLFLFVGMGYTSRGRDLYWSIPLHPFL